MGKASAPAERITSCPAMATMSIGGRGARAPPLEGGGLVEAHARLIGAVEVVVVGQAASLRRAPKHSLLQSPGICGGCSFTALAAFLRIRILSISTATEKAIAKYT